MNNWDEERQRELKPFTDVDFEKWNMDPAATNGVHAKQFLNDLAGGAWVAKSGALNEPFGPAHTSAVERGRRVAFPLNEALASLHLSAGGH